MAEERDLAMVRATDATDDTDATKEELQRRMEMARESITQTVAEIKDTVTNQYQAVRETVTEALDWREQFRKRPVAFSVGALSVGFIVGYGLGGVLKGGGDAYDYDDEEERAELRVAATPASAYYQSEGAEGARPAASRSYAAQAITGGSYGSSDYEAGSQPETAKSAYSPVAYSPAAYSSETTEESASADAEQAKGPGLIERFKGSKAYDRLEEEVSALGDRFIDELSKTAQTVVLPALFSKVKEMFGVDLSDKEGSSRSSARSSQGGSASSSSAAATNAALSGGAQSSFAGVNRNTAGQEEDRTLGAGDQGNTGSQSTGGGSSYATSENRGYGASAGGGEYGRGSD
ncbi:MAG TPA: hypothetical protein VF553_10795 [Pyrinomonadaceae bacterium]|jgi:hypothetical protein